MLIKFCRG